MPIYEITAEHIEKIQETTFSEVGIRERADLQRLLRDQIAVIAPDTVVVSEEFGRWEDSHRRIDLLAIDKEANLVVIELKRTEDGGHMELQAIRYAAMVSTMTFDQVVATYERFLESRCSDADARQSLLDFLEWDEPDDDSFAQDVRIVLVSAEFSKELTTSVLWLNDLDLDIRCVRIHPYKDGERVLIDVQQVVPLPEAVDYQVKLKEKKQKGKSARQSNIDFTRYDVTVGDEVHHNQWKRNAIHKVVKHVVSNGADPDRIHELFGWRKGRIWLTLDGELDNAAFVEQAASVAEKNGGRFEVRRWYCNDGDLVQFKGRTYAFSNQWGGEGWRRAMDTLVDAFPKFEITYRPTE